MFLIVLFVGTLSGLSPEAANAGSAEIASHFYSNPKGFIVAPELATLTLSGMGLAGVGWVRRRVRRRNFKAQLIAQAAADGFVIVEPVQSSYWQNISERIYLSCKRLMDILVTLLALIVLAPLFLAVIIAIKLDSRGPVFYGQKRLGEGRKTFKLFKFRSMCINADEVLKKVLAENEDMRKEFEELFKLKNDPRITRVGAFLRKTSLDELPQLLNVLIGDISLVGPRPIVDAEVERYWPFEDRLFSVKPGMTGLWQISGRNDTTYEERVRLDMRYISERNLWRDIYILTMTIPSLLKRDGAY